MSHKIILSDTGTQARTSKAPIQPVLDSNDESGVLEEGETEKEQESGPRGADLCTPARRCYRGLKCRNVRFLPILGSKIRQGLKRVQCF